MAATILTGGAHGLALIFQHAQYRLVGQKCADQLGGHVAGRVCRIRPGVRHFQWRRCIPITEELRIRSRKNERRPPAPDRDRRDSRPESLQGLPAGLAAFVAGWRARAFSTRAANRHHTKRAPEEGRHPNADVARKLHSSGVPLPCCDVRQSAAGCRGGRITKILPAKKVGAFGGSRGVVARGSDGISFSIERRQTLGVGRRAAAARRRPVVKVVSDWRRADQRAPIDFEGPGICTNSTPGPGRAASIRKMVQAVFPGTPTRS